MSGDSRRSDRPQLPLEVDVEIDRVSDAFERAWKAGHAPRIEDYLGRVPEIGRRQLLKELLVVEFDLRESEGATLDMAAYHQRFPDNEQVIRAAVALHERRRQDAARDKIRATAVQEAKAEEPPLPDLVGRFTIRRCLGRGGFGVVYLAHDPGLDRLVALKVPRSELLASGRQRESFLHEARTAAKLQYPSLVAVYEVQQDDDQIYIVQEYIEGQNLVQWAKAQTRSWDEIARRMIEISMAIGYVHQQGFYHRDLKPGNILIDMEGRAHVADFGLAVHEDAIRMLKGKAAGTPQYMSPEQVRGETHWIDGRTDIWALGVILYELLAGHRPFSATSLLDLSGEIQERDPQPPRMRNPAIPKELERICLKCLAKRRTQRYATAADLLEDLQAFLAVCPDTPQTPVTERADVLNVKSGSSASTGRSVTDRGAGDITPQAPTPTPDSGSQPPLKIVPQGLRSFDKEDKDFFLELLPGPRDREGLPDTIRFWKTRIEEMDADATFPVGVMYGPSGCGKSSLVKAGLLPHLAEHVLPVFVEATPNDTELRLFKQLRKRIPRLASEASLTEALAQLREGRLTDGRKVLLVLDQFEQWLHSVTNMDGGQLVRALRQCDGASVQCLILVRDDFWLSTTRLMQALEIPQLEGINSALVDLFDPSHARKVLRAFGLAYGRLPEHDLTADQQRFLDRAVQELAHDGKVICVQLSLFADMMKGRDWTPASLQEVGGTSGVGVAFLDETFTARTAPPTHRLHAKAAQAVLKDLLPEVGTDIKGQMQPAERLQECSEYSNRTDDFQDLLQILNAELRLITPTDPEGEGVTQVKEDTTDSVSASSHQHPSADLHYYQLTHDYLVPSLREWLTRKQKETRRGRAELKLAERTSLWNDKPENRRLPSLWEYGSIRVLTRSRDWSEPQRKMMRRAGRVHAARWGASLLLLLLVSLGTWRERMRDLQEQVRTTVVSVSNSRGAVVPYAIKELQSFPADKVLSVLKSEFANPQSTPDQRSALAYALAKYGHVERETLLAAIATAASPEVDNLASALAYDRDAAIHGLRQSTAAATEREDWQLKTRLATIALYLGDTSIAAEMLQAEPPPAPKTTDKSHPQAFWDDPPLDPAWAVVDDRAKHAIAAAHGMITDRLAFCLDMPWETFLTVMETLRPSGYRPTRVRPFSDGDRRRAAAVWTRDAQPFQLDPARTLAELPPADQDAKRAGLVPADVAAYAGDDGTARYCVLWSEPTATAEQRRLLAGLSKEEWEAAYREMKSASYRVQALHGYVSADGARHFAAVWSKQAAATEAHAALTDAQIRGAKVLWDDISIAVPGRPPHPLDLQRQLLSTIDSLPPEQQNTPERRLDRAKAHYYLDQPQEALRDLEVLAAEPQPSAEALLFAAMCRAQLGQADEAAADLAKCVASPQGGGWSHYGKILMDAWLGKAEEARRDLDVFVQQSERDSSALYNAACVAAQLTRILKASDPTDIAAWRQRALDLLKQSYSLGHSGSAGVENDPDFAPLHDAPAFQTLVAELVTSRCYAGVWRRERDFESWVETAGSWEVQQQAARAKVAEDWRPVAVAVNVVPNQSEPQISVIWRRPRLAPPPIRPGDPVQRTMFIEWFPKWAGSVEKLVNVIDGVDDPSLRSGVCLAVGSIKEPIPETKEKWQEVWNDWHVNQPDGGTHSASASALRAWELPVPSVPVEQVKRADFTWRWTKAGLTMIRIAAGTFERPEGQGFGEDRKTVRVETDFWLSDCEITTGLFRQFLEDGKAERPEGLDEIIRGGSQGAPSLPMTSVSWNDAVMFCNWLSDQEELSPCYEKDGKEQIKLGDGERVREYNAWKLLSGADGFRLPTEDEWEYACRATTTTEYCFGDTDDFLDRYAVFVKNAKGGPDPVAQKLCNGWGLFDMHGNVGEWCQDTYDDRSNHTYRGGCWCFPASACRAAFRNGYQRYDRYGYLGFRVASFSSGQ